MTILVQIAAAYERVWVSVVLVDDSAEIFQFRRLDQHHFKAHRVEKFIEPISLVQERQNLDVVVHDVEVFNSMLFLLMLPLFVFVDHTPQLLAIIFSLL